MSLPAIRPLLDMPAPARDAVAACLDFVIMRLFAKPWPPLQPKVSLPQGGLTQEKIRDVGAAWAKYLGCKCTHLNFGGPLN